MNSLSTNPPVPSPGDVHVVDEREGALEGAQPEMPPPPLPSQVVRAKKRPASGKVEQRPSRQPRSEPLEVERPSLEVEIVTP